MATGINVSKSNVYSVLGPPTGEDVAKSVTYTVLGPPTGIDVAKTVMYTVLSDGAVFMGSGTLEYTSNSVTNGPHRNTYNGSGTFEYTDTTTFNGPHFVVYLGTGTFEYTSSTTTRTSPYNGTGTLIYGGVAGTYNTLVIPPPNPGPSSEIDIFHDLDVCDISMRPNHVGGMGVPDFLGQSFILNPDDYNGICDYSLNIIAQNQDPVASHDVVLYQIIDAFGGTYSVSSTITIPADTTAWTYFKVPWTPAAGSNAYFWHVPDVGGGYSSVLVSTARVILKQYGATNTLLWRPVTGGLEGSVAPTGGSAVNEPIGFSWGSPDVWHSCGGTWYWNASLYQANGVSIVLEATTGSSYAGVDTDVCLWDLTVDTIVPGSTFSIHSGGWFSSPAAICARTELSAALLSTGHLYEMRFRRHNSWGGGVTTDWLSNSGFYRGMFGIRLIGISSCEVVYRVSKGAGTFVPQTMGSSRCLIENPGGHSLVTYLKNETCSQAVFNHAADSQADYWITDDGHLLSGDAATAATVADSNAHQPSDGTVLPHFSADWKSVFVSGDMYTARQEPTTVGGDPSSVWTLVVLGLTALPPALGTRQTLVYAVGLMEGRSGWFADHYNPSILVHYGEEGENIHAILCGGADGGLYQLTGDSDNGQDISCEVMTPSRDQSDIRFNKLYGDIMLDCNTQGTDINATPQFNNNSFVVVSNTVNTVSRTQVPVVFGPEWITARNVSAYMNWLHNGPTAEYLYTWEPRFTEEGGKVSAFSWETCWLTHELHGYFFHGYLYCVHISNADLLFEIINPDGTAAAAVTIPSSGSQHHKDFIRLPVVKGKIYKYRISSEAEFRIEGQESELLVKAWGATDAWRRERIFQDVPGGTAA